MTQLEQGSKRKNELESKRDANSDAQLNAQSETQHATKKEVKNETDSLQPFLHLAQNSIAQSPLRAAITAAYRRSEAECIPELLNQARLQPSATEQVQTLASLLVNSLRGKAAAIGKKWGVQSLVQAFSLSTQEGVALMCLAEALLRIPDAATRDALIRDKIAQADWKSYLGKSGSLFVNAATWGLLITGKVLRPESASGLRGALLRLLAKGGEPLIRQAMDLAMRLMGAQFVAGKTIDEALIEARKQEALGFSYSYDMLGEAAMTAPDAERYMDSYEAAIHAIGRAATGRGVYAEPGISIKLSALHPRYSLAQRARVMDELYPRLKKLALLAHRYDIGLNIDAEETDRLDISLDLLERLCFEPQLSGWNGVGFVVQAYQKRAPYVLDYVIDLARRSQRRLMVRLVKGAYWDSEIKRAQQDGLDEYPVYTRKVYTDISYLACAKKLLAEPSLIFPQFATHNAHTVASIIQMAGADSYVFGQYEFQCLHGMGEALYEDIVLPRAVTIPTAPPASSSAPSSATTAQATSSSAASQTVASVAALGSSDLNGQGSEKTLAAVSAIATKVGSRPCRIYAPVGTHETLLAYLVRRLLENGANTSFVNQIADPSISLEQLIADPIQVVEQIIAHSNLQAQPSQTTPSGLAHHSGKVFNEPAVFNEPNTHDSQHARAQADPTQTPASALPTLLHPKIPLPRDLYGTAAQGGRQNARGLDLSDEDCLSVLSTALLNSAGKNWQAAPLLAGPASTATTARLIRNPADQRDIVGTVYEANAVDVSEALSAACQAAPAWAASSVVSRAQILEKAAQSIEAQPEDFIALLVREAGKTLAHAIGEVREAIDFLRYYAWQLRHSVIDDENNCSSTGDATGLADESARRPDRAAKNKAEAARKAITALGPVVCISPWNFPLAIFIGQISAALAAGNPVLAKAAEQTPLIAAEAVRVLHAAGVPAAVLQFLPGEGETVGSALVADSRIRAVMFTGSTAVARLLQKQLAGRLDERGQPLTLIAETGGQNAMIVDSSALPEQVVADVLQSAFGSAGQRCSALRVLCLQEEIAEPILTMLKGAMRELQIGQPDRLETDVGPVIDHEAYTQLNAHIDRLRATHSVYQAQVLPSRLSVDAAADSRIVETSRSVECATQYGTFIAPTLIELKSISELQQEIFGPVLHIVRYPREQLDSLLEAIANTSYGLTMGLHTRIYDTVAYVKARAHVGNLYVNRSMVGAVVGVQPFGGEGLSGTGPKAGGPLLLGRLSTAYSAGMVARALPQCATVSADETQAVDRTQAAVRQRAMIFSAFLRGASYIKLADICAQYWPQSSHNSTLRLAQNYVLPGPTGESNTYTLGARGTVLCVADTEEDLLFQTVLVVITGNRAVWLDNEANRRLRQRLPVEIEVEWAAFSWNGVQLRKLPEAVESYPNVVLFSGQADMLSVLCCEVAAWPGAIVSVVPVNAAVVSNTYADDISRDGVSACEEQSSRQSNRQPSRVEIPLAWIERLSYERVCSINTAAAGGNASLMTME